MPLVQLRAADIIRRLHAVGAVVPSANPAQQELPLPAPAPEQLAPQKSPPPQSSETAPAAPQEPPAKETASETTPPVSPTTSQESPTKEKAPPPKRTRKYKLDWLRRTMRANRKKVDETETAWATRLYSDHMPSDLREEFNWSEPDTLQRNMRRLAKRTSDRTKKNL
jgi:hypothetical protein